MNAVETPDVDTPERGDDADWLVLDADEELLWSGRPRLSAILPSVVVGLALVGGGVALGLLFDSRLAATALLGVLPPAWSHLVVTNTRFVVTSEALSEKRGVFGRRVNRVPLAKVQNSSFSQDLTGRLFGYGSVTFEEAGGSSLRFFRIESPEEVRRFVDRRAGRENESKIPGTPEQWAAVLDEVRALRRALDDGSA